MPKRKKNGEKKKSNVALDVEGFDFHVARPINRHPVADFRSCLFSITRLHLIYS
jgi:hypothetical protein